MKRQDHLTPKARKDELVIRELSDELLVYDLKLHQAHCLNQTAAAVWKLCDGKATVRDITNALTNELQMPVDERIVALALKQLAKFHLLDGADKLQLPPEILRVSRREMMRRMGVAAAVALPLIISISAPTTVQAASCVTGSCTAGGLPCCVGTCQSGICVGN
jgi:hypothetical protein